MKNFLCLVICISLLTIGATAFAGQPYGRLVKGKELERCMKIEDAKYNECLEDCDSRPDQSPGCKPRCTKIYEHNAGCCRILSKCIEWVYKDDLPTTSECEGNDERLDKCRNKCIEDHPGTGQEERYNKHQCEKLCGDEWLSIEENKCSD